MASISVSTEKLEFNANPSSKKDFTVTIDGKKNGTGFRYDVVGEDWFDVIPNKDNGFDIVPKENFNVSERTGYITLHHNDIQGENGEKVITIVQKGIECMVGVSSDTIQFTSDNPLKDEVDITVIVSGGNEKYFIQSFKEFDKDGHVIKNDNGIKVVKKSNTLLTITSYGRVFLEPGQYYEIVLAHDNDRTKTAKIKVGYDSLAAKDTVPTISTNNVARLSSKTMETETLSTTKIKTNQQLIEEYKNETVQEPYIILTSYNPSTKKLLKSKAANSNDIVFEHDGGSKSYKIETYPENALVSVKITSDFVSYKIEDRILTLTAVANPYITERKCNVKIKNIYNQSDVIDKTIIQKGVE